MAVVLLANPKPAASNSFQCWSKMSAPLQTVPSCNQPHRDSDTVSQNTSQLLQVPSWIIPLETVRKEIQCDRTILEGNTRMVCSRGFWFRSVLKTATARRAKNKQFAASSDSYRVGDLSANTLDNRRNCRHIHIKAMAQAKSEERQFILVRAKVGNERRGLSSERDTIEVGNQFAYPIEFVRSFALNELKCASRSSIFSTYKNCVDVTRCRFTVGLRPQCFCRRCVQNREMSGTTHAVFLFHVVIKKIISGDQTGADRAPY